MSYQDGYQTARVPLASPAQQPKERVGLTSGRIVNFVILLIHVATFITALCTIGLVGSVMDQIAAVKNFKEDATRLGTCPFYVGPKISEGDVNLLAPNGVCLWFISGHVILAIAAIVFFITGVVRIVFAMNIGYGTIAELIALPLLILLAFAVAVSLSIGIPVTCDNVNEPNNCQYVGFPSGLAICDYRGDICWYGYAKSAEAAAWIIHIFLVVYFAITIARLAIFIRRRKEEKRRRQLLDSHTAKEISHLPPSS